MLKISSNFNESLNDDFIEILSRTEKIWKKSKKKIFLLTGCTGFFGYWLVRSFIEANKKYNLNGHDNVTTKEFVYIEYEEKIVDVISILYIDIQSYKNIYSKICFQKIIFCTFSSYCFYLSHPVPQES